MWHSRIIYKSDLFFLLSFGLIAFVRCTVLTVKSNEVHYRFPWPTLLGNQILQTDVYSRYPRPHVKSETYAWPLTEKPVERGHSNALHKVDRAQFGARNPDTKGMDFFSKIYLMALIASQLRAAGPQAQHQVEPNPWLDIFRSVLSTGTQLSYPQNFFTGNPLLPSKQEWSGGSSGNNYGGIGPFVFNGKPDDSPKEPEENLRELTPAEKMTFERESELLKARIVSQRKPAGGAD